ncbi:MAG TPA: prepilin-type N-terminal cleavage/methylation domain-containing protein [Candidatus Acidoferrales bacterium]|nr:prepilin-type N-terminal cleavage/methylation domain-containing protein [Candidatus Acidoferrales bacterium]
MARPLMREASRPAKFESAGTVSTQPAGPPPPLAAGGRGFTLLELVIVLTIVALAAALVVPNLARAFADAELRLEARAVANLFLQARERALYRAGTYLVVFGPVAGRQRTLYLAGEDGKVANKITLPAGISLRGRTEQGEWAENPPPARFFPNGSSEPLQIDLAGENKSHVQMRLDPLTGGLKVAELYKEN